MAWWTALAGQGMAQMGKMDDALTGMALGKFGDNRQYFQQKRLQGLAVRGQKELADYEQQLAMEMWKNTGPEAQREQIEKAGLNVGLMMGGAGGGGGRSQGASVGNIGNANAAPGSQDILHAMEVGQQARTMQAQQQLIEAQAEKTKVETENLKGVEKDKTKQDTAESLARTEHEKAKQKLTELEGRLKEATIPTIIEQTNAERDKMVSEAQSAKAQGEYDELTLNTKIDAINLANTETQVRILAGKAGISKTKIESASGYAAIQKIAKEIETMNNQNAQKWKQMSLQERELWIKEQLGYLQKQGIDFSTGEEANIIRWINALSGLKR